MKLGRAIHHRNRNLPDLLEIKRMILGYPLVAGLIFLLFITCPFAYTETTNSASLQETNAPMRTETNSPALKETPLPARQETKSPSRVDYSSFKIIADRNIFNPNRSSRSARGSAAPSRRAKVDTFSLVGTLSSEKGSFAFFDSPSSQYKKVLKRADAIAGYKVKDITLNHVKLESGGKEIKLLVGSRMRKEQGGEWKMVGQTDSSASGTNSSASEESAASSSDEEADETLRKLMQQREEELNK